MNYKWVKLRLKEVCGTDPYCNGHGEWKEFTIIKYENEIYEYNNKKSKAYWVVIDAAYNDIIEFY